MTIPKTAKTLPLLKNGKPNWASIEIVHDRTIMIKSKYWVSLEDFYNLVAARAVIGLRRLDPAARRERQGLIDTYLRALGMEFA